MDVRSAESISAWLVSKVASLVGRPARHIDRHERFSRYGLHSLQATTLVSELAVLLNRSLPPTLLWEYPTIDAVTGYLVGETPPAPRIQRPIGKIDTEPIAVIGLACRFPQARDPAAFWRLLSDGIDAVTEVPATRWNLDDYYDADAAAPGKMSTRWGGFLDRVDTFDPDFFGISPREAVQMDPQQRLILELAWECLEDAGIPAESLRGTRTGVYVGAMWGDYARLLQGAAGIVQHTATGQDPSIIAARVSYLLGLQGPSMAINTACSSSLVAVHLACQSLHLGESDVALVGGVNLMIAPETTVAMSKFGAMAADGRSRAFDSDANGYVRGEGAGVVLLKRLSSAIAAGDPITCVIAGSAVNNDGFSNGLTAPNPRAQEDVLRDAYARAGVDPHQVHYVEAHGTGTPLGDPIEANALGAVLGVHRSPENALWIGSVKSNIGHLEAAAGMAGLIKVALAIRYRAIPRSLHFEAPNPHIDFEALRLRVPESLQTWPEPGVPALAGVSSFGFGGTNSHIVLLERRVPGALVAPLAAESDTGLRSLAIETARRLRAGGACDSPAGEHRYRVAATGRTIDELAANLEAFAAGDTPVGVFAGSVSEKPAAPVFLFPGQGGQWAGMGRELLETEPAFRACFMLCQEALADYIDWSPLEELLATGDEPRWERVEVAQPLLFALQVSLAALWWSMGIDPAAVVGHSMGEVAAAHVAGALTLGDAARVISRRSQLQGRLSGNGAMAIVGLSKDDAAAAIARLDHCVSIAAINGPRSTVLSGDPATVQEVVSALEKRGVFCRRVRVDVASHSPQMEPLLTELVEALQGIRPIATAVPMVSTVTGAVIDGRKLGPEYWCRNLREPVRFADALQSLRERRVFLELNPHPILARDVEETLEGTCIALPSTRRDESERLVVRETLARLYAEGAAIDWRAIGADVTRGDQDQPGLHLLPLSAHDPDALRDRARAVREMFSQEDVSLWRDVCYTASARRSHLSSRIALTAESAAEASELLDAYLRGEAPPGLWSSPPLRTGQRPGLAFVFSGQGAQWTGMGRALLDSEPEFRRAFEECDLYFSKLGSWSLVEELRSDAGGWHDRTDVAQPLLFALQVALAALWRARGVEPDAVVGHGVGEIAAATVAGKLTLPEAVRVVFHRGRLMHGAVGRGQMAVVECGPSDVERVLAGNGHQLDIAAVNSFRSTTLSGDAGALGDVLRILDAEGIGARLLKGSYAFHSAQMSPLGAQLREALGRVQSNRGTVPMYSTVTGAVVDELDAAYWARNVTARVRFADVVDKLIDLDCGVYLEVGPHPVLAGAMSESLQARGVEGVVLPSLHRERDDREMMLGSLARLYTLGFSPDWTALFPSSGRVVCLPPYPWRQERYWIDDQANPEREQVPEPTSREADVAAEAPRLLAGLPISGSGVSPDGVYTLEWESRPRADVEPVGPDAGWVVISDGEEFAAALAERLSCRRFPPSAAAETRGRRVACVVEDGRDIEQVLAVVRAEPAQLWILTRGSHPAVWGLGRTVALEHPEFWGGLIDVESADADATAAELLQPDGETQIALRNDGRYVARLAPYAVPAEAASLRPDGTYLITGGLGALGLHLARWLSDHGAGNLVLCARRAPTAAATAIVDSLGEAGTRVHVVSADVSRQEDMARVLAEIAETMSPLCGVFHAAGVLDDGVIVNLTVERFDAVMAAKARGAWNLHVLTRDLQLDHFVLFSSAAGLLGATGQANYAAANAFLDGLAHRRRAEGLPALSVDLGPWADGGMASTDGGRGIELWESRGIGAIAPARALDLLGRLMRGSSVQVAVLPAVSRAAKRAADPATDLADFVRQQAAGVLDLPLERLAVDRPLNRLGIDSLMAVDLRDRIEKTYGVAIPMVTFLGENSVTDLVRLIGEQLNAAGARPIAPLAASVKTSRLSSGQRSLWFIYQSAPRSAAYNIGFTARVRGRVDEDALHATLQALVDRHPVLTSTFSMRGDDVVQTFTPGGAVSFVATDLGGEAESSVTAAIDSAFHAPFDLENGPVFRAALFRVGNEEAILQLVVHHIVVDFWSLLALVDELRTLYAATAAGGSVTLPDLKTTFAEAIEAQGQSLAGAESERLWEYWRDQIDGAPPLLNLPADRSRPAIQTYDGDSMSFALGLELTGKLKALAVAEGVTFHTVLMAAFGALLHRYSGQDDMLLGTLTSGRSRAEWADVAGYFVNPVPVRMRPEAQLPFRDHLAGVRRSLLGALEHQNFPFTELVERLQPARDAGYSPLLQVMFVLQQPQRIAEAVPFMLGQTGGRLQFGDLALESIPMRLRQARFDLDVMMMDSDDGLRGFLQYNTALFNRQTVERLAEHFRFLLEGLAADPARALGNLPLLSAPERRAILQGFNDTARDFSGQPSLPEAVAAHAAETPFAIAAVCCNRSLTYRELNVRANRLAHALRRKGVGPEVLVGVCLDRTLDMLVGLLGILKSGGAYLPLAPSDPPDRLQFILDDARVSLVVTEEALVGRLPASSARLLCLDTDAPAIAQESTDNPEPAASDENLAYVIYTSGSTGRPKGTEIPHRALTNFLWAMQENLTIAQSDTLLAVTTLSFDIAGLELFLPLIAGARVIIAGRADAADGNRLRELLAGGVTVMQATPATWQMLIADGWQGNRALTILCGGEPLSRALASELLTRGAAVWNLYGPTETTIWSTMERIEPGDELPSIGRPIANTRVYILDSQHQPVPINVAGEMLIGGAGVARGYLNRPELTTERFVEDPFEPTERVYRTGDLCRFRSDGRIEFLGRNDYQVKLRGFRIETGEIEATLAEHPRVRDVVVTAREDEPGDPRLVAYVVSSPDEESRHADHVAQWRDVWEETYRQPGGHGDPTFNVTGWNSSYTGEPIPAEEMDDWLNHAVGRVRALRPRRVLEIGCGSGMLLFRLAPGSERYVGTDFSQGALDYIEAHLTPALRSHVELLQRDADDFSDIPEDAFDTVVLNSVVQYFPDIEYLLRVLRGAVRVLKPGGTIVAGDIRSLPLLKAFHASVQLHQTGPNVTLTDLASRIATRLTQEEELAIDPAFFATLRERVPEVGSVEVLPKRGRFPNEMTKFRYDVLIHCVVGERTASPASRPWQGENAEAIGRLVHVESGGVAGAGNARLAKERALLRWLASDDGPATVGGARDALRSLPVNGIDPEEMWDLGAFVDWSTHGEEGELRICAGPPAPEPSAGRSLRSLANDPLRAQKTNALVPALRKAMRKRLPDYMVPGAFVVLDELPRLPNGKVNRAALPAPDRACVAPAGSYVAPQTDTERTVARVWQDVLQLDRVGSRDNFFDLGGHSLLLIQVRNRLREIFAVDIPTVALLQHPSVSAQAAYLRAPADTDPALARSVARAEKRRALGGWRVNPAERELR